MKVIHWRFRLPAFLSSLLLVTLLQSQTVLDVQLSDQNHKPVGFAIIKHRGAILYSNDAGFARISTYHSGEKLSIHRMGFADTVVSVTVPVTRDTFDLAVVLRTKPFSIPEVSITSGKPEEVNPMKSDFVLGYELKGDYLVELLSDDNLALIDLENVRSSHSKPVTGATELLRDAWGNLYLATREKAFQLEPRGLTLPAARTPVDLNDLKWHIRYCDDASGNVTFIRRYKDVNQSLGFFAISGTKNQQAYLLKEISDKERKSAVQAFGYRTAALNQYLADRGLSKVTATTMAELALVNEALEQTYFFEGVYLTPSYSLIRLVNDSVYLFAHDIDSILVFDRGLNLVRSTFIDYHRLKVWDKEIIVNEERSKAYAKLKKDGQPMLAEIDLQTGTLKSPYFKMGMIFPQRIRIRKDVVYFMAKQQGGVGYSVYAQKLER